MRKRPVLLSFAVAAVISIVTLFAWMSSSHNVDERPFIAAGVVLAFPFVWFLAWVIVNAVNWWRETTNPPDAG